MNTTTNKENTTDNSTTTTMTMTKKDLLALLRTFNPNFLSRKTVEKYLKMGDGLEEEEIRLFMRMIPVDGISLNDFVDILYE